MEGPRALPVGLHWYLTPAAEGHGLCPWMNAQNVAEYFTHRSIGASADFAVGG